MSRTITVELQEKGNNAERRFMQYLDAHDIHYVRIDQHPETLSAAFQTIAKRPDFEVFLDNIGSIMVDVKSLRFNKQYHNFTLDESEVQLLLQYELLTHRPVWLAITTDEIGHAVWFFISVQAVVTKTPKRMNSITLNVFRAITIEDCVVIGPNGGLGSLLCRSIDD